MPQPPDADLRAEERRRWAALVVVCVGALMIILDSTIVNVALPQIQDDLGFSQSSLTWLVNAYLVSFGSLLLISGRLGDILGRKRMFLWGLVVFVGASVLCGVATERSILIGGRFLQGVGGALATASVLAIIVTEFPKGPAQAKALSIYMFVGVAGGTIGLLVGGVITETLSWHWIFFINVPIGIVTYVAGRRLIHESKLHGTEGGIDYLGGVLMTLAAAIGIYAIIGAEQDGWLSAQTLGLGAISLVLLAGFLLLESRVENPIMPLRILRVRSLIYANLISATTVVGMFSTFFLGALFLERALGYDPMQIGFAFLPIPVTISVLALGPTAKLMNRFGPSKLVLAGLPLATIALALMSTATENTAYFPLMFGVFLLLGIGMGLSFAPLLAIAVRDIEERDAGLASGIVNVAIELTGAFGLAVLASLAADRTASAIADGVASVPAFVEGFQLACIISAVVMACGFVLTLLAARDGRSAHRIADTIAAESE